MRICRFEQNQTQQLGFYGDSAVIPVSVAAAKVGIGGSAMDSVLVALPGGGQRQIVRDIQQRLGGLSESELAALRVPMRAAG